MPVDYTIASRNALANTPTDFTNMLAQYQMMGARAQQQELVQQQLAEYERARQEEESYRNLATQQGFDPLSRQSLVQAYQISPTLGMKVLSAQEQAKAHAAMAANQASDASIRQQRFQAELPTLLAGAGKAKTEQAMADLTMTRDLAAGVLQTGKGFDKLKEHISKSPWASMLGDKPDPSELRALATQATTFQKYLEPHLQTIQNEVQQVVPGIGGAPPVVRPAVVTPPDMGNIPATPVTAPPEGKLGGRVPTGAPEGMPTDRQPMTQREYKELPMRQQSTEIFGDILNNYEKLYKHGSMASEQQSMTTRFRNVMAGTPAGQEVARITDPEGQKYRDVIDKQIDQYIQTRRALGITSAQEANTIDELIRLKSMLGSPKFSIETAREILSNADKYAGTGKLKIPEPKEQSKGVVDGRTLLTGPRQKELRSILHGE
jgi:hypothetical protein